MKNKLLSIFALALLPASLAVPQVANAYTHCIGTECEVSFTYVGEYQTFTPPKNATNFRFEVYGAAGGRGGAGGVVKGTLTQVPQTMFIYVGGIGGMGSGIAGGFNGGGAAGGNSGTEGSGGGATDIRTSHTLDSRIVVAGGGGGGGGEAGGVGGHGGTLLAANGGSGQASGGGGATQTSGGLAGVSNGGFQAGTDGQLGLGGSGGFSTYAGGGGGGGGYYGGGGGGADDNTCCSDGGGGGGGSSYADTEYTSGVTHKAGVSWGHGWVVFRYTLVPGIDYADFIQVSNQRAVFTIEASEEVVGLEPEELSVAGEGCEISELTVDGTLIYGAVTGCLGGEAKLTLAAESFGSTNLGPVQAEVLTLDFDTQAPSFSFLTDNLLSSQSNLVVPFAVSDQLALQPDFFQLQGCDLLEVGVGELLLSECVQGVGSLALLPNSLVDSWQNVGPVVAITMSFVIDQTAPLATWSEVVIAGTGPYSYSAALEFSEHVVIENLALALAASVDCESGHEVLNTTIQVWASCHHAVIEWSLTAVAIDQVGHQLQLRDFSVGVSNLAPVALPKPTPIYVPVIVEVPAAAPAPVVTPPVTESELVEVTQSPVISQSPTLSDEVTESNQVIAVPAIVNDQPATEQLEVLASNESIEVPAALPVEVTELDETAVEQEDAARELTEPVVLTEDPITAEAIAGEEVAFQQPGFPWLPLLMVLGLGVLGFGAWRFSGR